MSYVDGFVLVVPKKKRKEYLKMAKDSAKIWKEFGAVAYMECVGDDVNSKMCELPFPKMTKCKPDEEVWFSFIVYKTKADRNRVNKNVMKEMCKRYPDYTMKDMPFDMKKMSFGGFKALVEC